MNDKISLGSKLSLGALNPLTKRVGAKAVEAQPEVSAKPAAKAAYQADALVRTAGPQAVSSAQDLVKAAELRLAKAYDPNPVVFAKNLAQSSLAELVSHVG